MANYDNTETVTKHELKTLYLIFLSVISQETSGQSLSISWLRPIYARFLLLVGERAIVVFEKIFLDQKLEKVRKVFDHPGASSASPPP